MRNLALVGLWLVPAILIYAAYLMLRRMGVGRRSSERLFTQPSEREEPVGGDGMVAGLLRRWLFLAGYRQPAAPAAFVAATIVAIAFALAAVYIVRQTGLLDDLLRNLALLPPGVGDLFVPLAYLAPWMVFLMLATVPWLAVRRSRRDRVERVEQDLPLSLELLATLSEAGLGFDAALARVLNSVREDRPLAREFRTYQSDLLAGRTRVESFRRLARRLEISSVTILVSALVQAEQLGTGIAQALRRQADDLRDRRRERANAFALALPVKRMFPLVVCFMPGIFVWTLGPFFVQLFQYADTFVRVKRL
jgi:tight adherence protein C